MVSPRAIKWREKKNSENFQVGPIYGGPNIGFFDFFGILRLFYFFIVPYNREINFFDPKN